MTNNRPIIIGVTGGSGSGKTSISRAILDQFPNHSIMMLEHDSYYKNQDHLVFEERLNTNYDHPFAFDTDLLIEHLEQLRRFETIENRYMIMSDIPEVLKSFYKSQKKSLFLKGF